MYNMFVRGDDVKILIVDDEEMIRNVIKEYCINESYDVDEAENGFDALELLNKNHYNMLILDIMMPEMDGFSLLKKLDKKLIPTIVLSARSEEYDILQGFDLGIDDYITKPFSPKELMARIKALSNRTKKRDLDTYSYKDLKINFSSHTLKVNNKKIDLTPKEFELLKFLIENKEIAISREQLLNKIWGYDFFGDDRTIDTHIKMLRNNLGEFRNNIVTIRGFGYKYTEDLDEE